MNVKTRKTIVIVFWSLFGAGVLSVILLLAAARIWGDLPSFEQLEDPTNNEATLIFSADGDTLATMFRENRINVTLDNMSPYLVYAAVATEDARFYEHSGIDIPSLGRVAFKTLIGGDSSQGGGSTITQQLAKNIYEADDKRQRNIRSKAKMVWVKMEEWVTAMQLERRYTKDEIMELYLNTVEFSYNTKGIDRAAKSFFGKQPRDLDIAESATLIAMINKPTRYNPCINPDKALERRNLVISRMAEAGFITAAEADSAKRESQDAYIHFTVQDHNAGMALYFRDMLKREMNATRPVRENYLYPEEYTADSLRWERDDLYGWVEKTRKADGSKYDLETDGLRIYTTIDSRMQRYAEEAVAEFLGGEMQPAFNKEQSRNSKAPFAAEVTQEQMDRSMRMSRRTSDRYKSLVARGASDSEIEKEFSTPVRMSVFAWKNEGTKKEPHWVGSRVDTTMTPTDSLKYYKNILRAAFVAVEPETGHVRAYVGGPDYRSFKFDNARQSLASNGEFQGKRQVGSTIKPYLYTLAMQSGMNPCTPVVNVSQTFMIGPDREWTPRSTDRGDWIGKTVTLKWGLTNSSNNISAYLMKQFGPDAMAHMMRKMGISSHLDVVPALCVGAADLSVLEMVAAYNTFPSRGVFIEPMFVTRIEDKEGNVISEFAPRRHEAISASTAYLMVDLMQGVVNAGTAQRLRSSAYYNLKGQIAGKTGTTNNNTDGWFIGYTPTITAGCWVGGEDKNVHPSMALGQGAHSALPIWGIWMKKVMADGTLGVTEHDTFTAPPGGGGYGCTGGDSDENYTTEEEENYFE
ncbi:MAG: transglycosylase domain-containing protein [Bacteroidales bacterium]|nr:transglycosylase domain-containing protein [Bacteroidales bacterium]